MLLITDTGPVRTITLNRPDVFNAFSEALTTALDTALKDAEKDAAVRAVILTGAGRAFSSGQDLGELRERYQPGFVPTLSDDLHRRYNPIIQRICGSARPYIAAVNGVAAGAGASLALACDVRIGSTAAAFMQVFINVGLVPDSGSTWFLPRMVGPGRALELCLTGRKVDAEESHAIGLLSKVVAPDRLDAEAQALALAIAEKPPRAVALTKRLLRRSLGHDLGAQLTAEAFDQETLGRTADHFEGVRSFIEKRPPVFTGR
ncbi:MAG: enoyl-CoA hydratase/isomerase family protein [Phycisphaeraceae bacterium]|nr:enoyl-CoA hydratase/isomerase family protein [Phycisphaeraceae bacterium]